MIILHAGLLDDRFVLWGEKPAEGGASAARRGRSSATAAMRSPYDAGEELSQLALEEWAGEIPRTKASRASGETAVVWLPSLGSAPVASNPLIALPPEPDAELKIKSWTVTARTLTWEQASLLLCACVGRDTLGPGVVIGTSLVYWATALRFAGALLARQKFLPDIEPTSEGYRALWRPIFAGTDAEAPAKLARAMPSLCRALTSDSSAPPEIPAVRILATFLTETCDTLVRTAREEIPVTTASVRKARTPTFDSLHDQWIYALQSPDGRLQGEPRELAALAAQARDWRRPLTITLSAPFRLCLRLEEPALEGEDRESPQEGWYVRYLLQSMEDPSLLVPVEKAWKVKGQTATLLRRDGFEPREYLLSTLGQASLLDPQIEASLKSPAPAGYDLDTAGAQAFLTEKAWLLEQSGFGVLLPAWWSRKGARLKLTARGQVKSPKMKAKAGLSLETLVEFDWEVALGGETLTREELERLAREKVSLVRVRGQWVQLDAKEIEAALEFWKRKGTEQRTVHDVIRLALGAQSAPGGLPLEGIQATGWVDDLLAQMDGRETLQEMPLPEAFTGTLRPYQQRGYDWLNFLATWGLGACLADDMGLGKTVQVLAFVREQWEKNGKRPTLVICPTSVVGNWQREAQRFTPDLPVLVHHGGTRRKGESFRKEAEKHALVLSSFSLLHRDFELLKETPWSGIILDEAQNIKNPETRQSKAARGLAADWRVALTGTPVENHVGDLWAILDFLNPGFLGSQSDFRRNFFVPIQANRDLEAADRLKSLTRPFILRRVKTDRSIIADLPDKMEMKVYCNLTPEQATLYEAVVKEAEEALEDSEGIQRKGIVLATLSRLKQVCNHPAQFLSDNSAIAGRSGKLARLTEMLEEALAAGDRALIFTQFTEMGEILRKHLQATFGKAALFLHGGVPKKQRDRMVEEFQSAEGEAPFFILSVKAGGVGLNLTAANHVFHFDRWWNPAVENQATDRAFRIGQKKNVQVHKFVCAGTMEEKIDAMIESKRQIASEVVGTGEDWLTELSTAELKALFALQKDAVGV